MTHSTRAQAPLPPLPALLLWKRTLTQPRDRGQPCRGLREAPFFTKARKASLVGLSHPLMTNRTKNREEDCDETQHPHFHSFPFLLFFSSSTPMPCFCSHALNHQQMPSVHVHICSVRDTHCRRSTMIALSFTRLPTLLPKTIFLSRFRNKSVGFFAFCTLFPCCLAFLAKKHTRRCLFLKDCSEPTLDDEIEEEENNRCR